VRGFVGAYDITSDRVRLYDATRTDSLTVLGLQYTLESGVLLFRSLDANFNFQNSIFNLTVDYESSEIHKMLATFEYGININSIGNAVLRSITVELGAIPAP
ncbi:MAG: hypothetical protein O7E57_03250, partial [Gammaproteobacteria bacterium]|nr:hypothetical protein [Gammaproteobacteria bacterium]